MDGPFDEPDEKFIRRQKAAYGEVSCWDLDHYR